MHEPKNPFPVDRMEADQAQAADHQTGHNVERRMAVSELERMWDRELDRSIDEQDADEPQEYYDGIEACERKLDDLFKRTKK